MLPVIDSNDVVIMTVEAKSFVSAFAIATMVDMVGITIFHFQPVRLPPMTFTISLMDQRCLGVVVAVFVLFRTGAGRRSVLQHMVNGVIERGRNVIMTLLALMCEGEVRVPVTVAGWVSLMVVEILARRMKLEAMILEMLSQSVGEFGH